MRLVAVNTTVNSYFNSMNAEELQILYWRLRCDNEILSAVNFPSVSQPMKFVIKSYRAHLS